MLYRIIHLTDLHIGLPTEQPHGVDVRSNFEKTIQSIESETYDLMVITGDYCLSEPSGESYDWVFERLSGITQPILHTAGNHDDARLLMDAIQSFSNIQQDGLDTCYPIPNGQVIVLDSGQARIDRRQRDWLEQALDNPIPSLLFTHYPILPMGVPHMDQLYPFEDDQGLLNLIRRQSQPISIFCGHYHTDRSWHTDRLNLFITPSNFVQIDHRTQQFKAAHYRVGYRVIEWSTDGLKTWVQYLD